MLFVNANILTMEQNEIPCGFLRAESGVISALGSMESVPDLQHGEECIDLGGKLLMPGLVDSHCHMGLVEDGLGFEGDDLNEDTDPLTPHLRAIDGVNPFDRVFAEAAAAGVTCVVVGPGSANPVAGQSCALKTTGRSVSEMAVAEPLAVKFALGENPKAAYNGKTQAPVTRMATAAMIREQLCKAQRYCESLREAEADPELEKPDYDAKCEALIPLLEGRMRAHFHAHRAYDILTAVRIATEFSLDYVLVHCTEGYLIADILAEQNARTIVGPLISTRTKPELSNLSIRNCAELVNAGLRAAISTDYPEMPADMLAAGAALAAANGLTRQQALLSITLWAAEAAGIEYRVGSLKPGKDADLLVYGADPLAVGAMPEAVYINGKKLNFR